MEGEGSVPDFLGFYSFVGEKGKYIKITNMQISGRYRTSIQINQERQRREAEIVPIM